MQKVPNSITITHKITLSNRIAYQRLVTKNYRFSSSLEIKYDEGILTEDKLSKTLGVYLLKRERERLNLLKI